jgi:hypothetical protein
VNEPTQIAPEYDSDTQRPPPGMPIAPGALPFFGCLVFFIVVVMVANLAYYLMSSRVEVQAKPAAEKFLASLKEGRNQEAIALTAAPPPETKAPPQDYGTLMPHWDAVLGRLQKWKRYSINPIRLNTGQAITIVYNGTFEKGKADILMQLAKTTDTWHVIHYQPRTAALQNPDQLTRDRNNSTVTSATMPSAR